MDLGILCISAVHWKKTSRVLLVQVWIVHVFNGHILLDPDIPSKCEML